MNGQRTRQEKVMRQDQGQPTQKRFDFGNEYSVPAVVERVNGDWKAVRLDGKPRIDDKFGPRTAARYWP